MKILHVVYSCVPGEFRGGIAKVVYHLAVAQADLGHDVTIFTTNFNSKLAANVPVGESISLNGIEIHYFQADDTSWFRSRRLRQALMQSSDRYDVIHSHNTFLALNRYAAEASRHLNKPLFYHVHGALDPIVVNNGLLRMVRKRLYIWLMEKHNLNNANGIFALSNAEVSQLRQYDIRTPVHILRNGIEPVHMNESQGCQFRQQWGIQKNRQIILFIGRIVPKKGVHVLLKAFASIQKEFPNALLVIAGDRSQDSSYVESLDEIVVERQLQDDVVWTGFLDEEEKKGVLSSATIFSHVSESEGLAMSILEAMAAGLPTIVSTECYMGDAARQQALKEVEYNVDSVASAFRHLLTDCSLRSKLSSTAKTYVHQQHSWRALAQQAIDIYDQSC